MGKQAAVGLGSAAVCALAVWKQLVIKARKTNRKQRAGATSAPVAITPITPIFGTYRLTGLVLADAANQALWALRENGLPELLDGAAKYRNLETVREVLAANPGALLGWKVQIFQATYF